MKTKFCLFVFILLINSSLLFSQVAINTDGSNPNCSAMLDVKSNNKGFLPPRMTQAQMAAIPKPADGLVVYCTDCRDGKGVLSIFIDGNWGYLTTVSCFVPMPPVAAANVPSVDGIVWGWKGVFGAIGYKWNISNDYATATHIDTLTTYAETGLYCNTAYTRYVWAFNACGNSLPLALRQTTSACRIPTLTTKNITSIASKTATSGGNISDGGDSAIKVYGVCWGTSPNPTTANSITTDGTGIGNFTGNLTGLAENTVYYVRAYAINSAGTAYGNEISFKTTPPTGTVADIDGNVYHYVEIGTQVWMVENLKTIRYRNGDPILNVADATAWATTMAGAYCWYNNDAATYKAGYGALYNWYAVADPRNIAPAGWHVPTDAEWTTLTNYLGGENVAGGKLKEAGPAHWGTSYGTNSSGFTALPGGFRSIVNGTFLSVGSSGYWWSSTEYTSADVCSRYMYYYSLSVTRYTYGKYYGFSVRCLRD